MIPFPSLNNIYSSIFDLRKRKTWIRRKKSALEGNFLFTFKRSAKNNTWMIWVQSRVRWNRQTSNESQSLFLKQTIECSFLRIIEAKLKRLFFRRLKLHHMHEMNFNIFFWCSDWLSKKVISQDWKSNQEKIVWGIFHRTSNVIYCIIERNVLETFNRLASNLVCHTPGKK